MTTPTVNKGNNTTLIIGIGFVALMVVVYLVYSMTHKKKKSGDGGDSDGGSDSGSDSGSEVDPDESTITAPIDADPDGSTWVCDPSIGSCIAAQTGDPNGRSKKTCTSQGGTNGNACTVDPTVFHYCDHGVNGRTCRQCAKTGDKNPDCYDKTKQDPTKVNSPGSLDGLFFIRGEDHPEKSCGQDFGCSEQYKCGKDSSGNWSVQRCTLADHDGCTDKATASLTCSETGWSCKAGSCDKADNLATAQYPVGDDHTCGGTNCLVAPGTYRCHPTQGCVAVAAGDPGQPGDFANQADCNNSDCSRMYRCDDGDGCVQDDKGKIHGSQNCFDECAWGCDPLHECVLLKDKVKIKRLQGMDLVKMTKNDCEYNLYGGDFGNGGKGGCRDVWSCDWEKYDDSPAHGGASAGHCVYRKGAKGVSDDRLSWKGWGNCMNACGQQGQVGGSHPHQFTEGGGNSAPGEGSQPFGSAPNPVRWSCNIGSGGDSKNRSCKRDPQGPFMGLAQCMKECGEGHHNSRYDCVDNRCEQVESGGKYSGLVECITKSSCGAGPPSSFSNEKWQTDQQKKYEKLPGDFAAPPLAWSSLCLVPGTNQFTKEPFLPGRKAKHAPTMGDGTKLDLNSGQKFDDWKEAWTKCPQVKDCRYISKGADGKYYLSEEGDKEGTDGQLMKWECFPGDNPDVCPIPDEKDPATILNANSGKNCVDNRRSECINDNTKYNTYTDAWNSCNKSTNCDVIMKATDGGYYLRRTTDPDDNNKSNSLLKGRCEFSKPCKPPSGTPEFSEIGRDATGQVSLQTEDPYKTFGEAFNACLNTAGCGFINSNPANDPPTYEIRRSSDEQSAQKVNQGWKFVCS